MWRGRTQQSSRGFRNNCARSGGQSHMKLAGTAEPRPKLMNIADRAPGGAEFAVVLTNDADAPVLEAAAERGIPTEVVERDADESRESHEERVLDALAEYDFDLVTLDGYMRVLSETFLDAAPTALNVHPCLPAFPGTDAHEQVLDAGVKTTGCTVHVVNEEVDAGPIVTQEAVPVYTDDDADDLKSRVLYDAEFKAYPRASSGSPRTASPSTGMRDGLSRGRRGRRLPCPPHRLG